MSGEASLLGVQMAAFSLGPHMAFPCAHMERTLGSLSLLTSTLLLPDSAPFGPHSAFITSLKALSAQTVILGVRASTYEF